MAHGSRYILTTVSTCECGQDIHSFLFKTIKEAKDAMRQQYKHDKGEIEPSRRVATLSSRGYEVYEKGRFLENHLVGKIIEVAA